MSGLEYLRPIKILTHPMYNMYCRNLTETFSMKLIAMRSFNPAIVNSNLDTSGYLTFIFNRSK